MMGSPVDEPAGRLRAVLGGEEEHERGGPADEGELAPVQPAAQQVGAEQPGLVSSTVQLQCATDMSHLREYLETAAQPASQGGGGDLADVDLHSQDSRKQYNWPGLYLTNDGDESTAGAGQEGRAVEELHPGGEHRQQPAGRKRQAAGEDR